MSEQDPQPAISKINLPHRLRRDGWWLEEFPVTCQGVIRAAPKLVLINGRQQKEEEHCKKTAR
jgi:hypothetical protein